jgi:hypothetical protein
MRAAIATALLAVALGARAEAPVAFVADIRGNATIEGDGRLAFLAELTPGTRLLLGSGATAAIAFASSGTEFTVSGPGEYLVTAAEVKVEKGASAKRRTTGMLSGPKVVAEVSRTATASLRMRGIDPGATAPKGALEYPVDTRVATLQPLFRWRDDARGAAYTVTLSEAGGKHLWKGPGSPQGTRTPVALLPGKRYSWTVASPAGTLGEARFETLPADEVARAEKSHALAGTFSGRVLHAMVLQDVGAVQDARDTWAVLARERPDLPELAALAR